jgi:hypothetical protein
MGGYKLEITGLNEILAKLDTKTMEAEIQLALDDFGLRVVREAKLLVPKDEDYLARSINSDPGKLSVTISANTDYAAYIEFGTRRFAAAYVSTLPAEWQQFAAQFKGSQPGSFGDFIKRIMAWIKRKGIDEAAAYPIAIKILREGIKAQPFLYPAIRNQTPLLIKDLEDILTL